MMHFKIDRGKRCDKIENKKVESFWEKLEKARKKFYWKRADRRQIYYNIGNRSLGAKMKYEGCRRVTPYVRTYVGRIKGFSRVFRR